VFSSLSSFSQTLSRVCGMELYTIFSLMSRVFSKMFKKKRKFLKIKFMKRRVSVKRVNIKDLYERLFKKLDVLYEKIKKRKICYC